MAGRRIWWRSSEGKANTCGEVDNIKAYRDALKNSLEKQPRKVGHIDYWSGSGTEPTLLDSE
jgi:hypothetical protein